MGVFDGRWDIQLTGNSKTGTDIMITQALGYDPLDVMYEHSGNDEQRRKKYAESATVNGKFLNGQWNVSDNSVGIECRDNVNRIWDLLTRLGFVTYQNSHCFVGNQSMELLKSNPEITTFISYQRKSSSLLALYLQAKFLGAGSKAFVDINHIKKGDEWEQIIRDRIQQCNYFICILAPETLDSNNVLNEILWAYEAKTAMIPIMHNDFQIPKNSHDYQYLRQNRA